MDRTFERKAQLAKSTLECVDLSILVRAKQVKKFLFVINDADFFISHRLPIARFLIGEGHEVHLATSGDMLPLYSEIGLEFHKLEVTRKGMSPIHELRLIWQLYKLFKRLKPDLVHLYLVHRTRYIVALALAGSCYLVRVELLLQYDVD